MQDDFSTALDPARWSIISGTVTSGGGTATFDGVVQALPQTAGARFNFDQVSWDVNPNDGLARIAVTADSAYFVFTVDKSAYAVVMNVTIGGVQQQVVLPNQTVTGVDTVPLFQLNHGFAVTGMRAGFHFDATATADGLLFEINVAGIGWVHSGIVYGQFPGDATITCVLTGTGATATGFLLIAEVGGDPGGGGGGAVGGLILSSTLVDAFDEAALDVGKWDASNATVTMGGGHAAVTGWSWLSSGSWDYQIDTAFVKLTVPAQSADVYAAFVATGPWGSPPPNWGFNIWAPAGATAQLNATWMNDDGQYDQVTVDYDPVAHAWLRVRSLWEQVSGDWWLTYICDAGPAPGQWTEMLRSPSLYSWFASEAANGDMPGTGYGIQFQTYSCEIDLADFNVGGGPVSVLSMKLPDGTYTTVGQAAHPLSMRMPDGTMRTWPGSSAPLYQCMPDGGWRKVITP